ncbi:MAG: serine/threonine-protein kinase [Dokdonella sp.]
MANNISLRDHFEDLLELEPTLRSVRIASLALPHEVAERLMAMLRFDESDTSSRKECLLDQRAADLRERMDRMLERMLVPDIDATSPLREEVANRLVASRGDDEQFVDRSLVGTEIGTFKLLELIGEGGSSAVFRAVRSAGDGSQFVALKVLRTGLYSSDAQRRFRREQSILARLAHPNIARFIEAGISAAGIPYIAMELVEGVAITRAADSRSSSLRDRLKLFCLLCRAVEAAHASLIVHMDLKPSNVLVTQMGDLKVVDFGISKLLDQESGASPTRSVALTPGYAAPEQYRSDPSTTAVDVYAMGVVLTELLTGQIGMSNTRPSALLHLPEARQSSVPAGMAPRGILERQLRGDLDDIVLKAVADEAQLRYPTAGALADDIERYLAGEPVRAHPPSGWYRARKFLSRHQAGVTLATFLLFAILAAMSVVVWQARDIRREAQRANTIRDFLEDMFAPIEDGMINDKQASVRDLLSAATQKLGDNATLDDTARIDLEFLFARLHEKLNDADQAEALANDAAGLATSKLAASDPVRADAEISRAYMLLELGKERDAEPLFDALQSSLDDGHAVHGPPLIRLYDGLAEVNDARNKHAAAVDYERKALTERISFYGSESSKAATGYANLATSLNFMNGHLDEAIDAYDHAYRIHLRNLGPNSSFTAFARRNLSVAQLLAGQLRAAREGLVEIEGVFESPPNNQRDVNVVYWEGRCQLAMEIGAAESDDVCDHASRAAEAFLSADNIALNASILRIRTQRDIDRGDFEAAQRRIQRARTLVGNSGNLVWVGAQDYLSGLLAMALGDESRAIEQFSSAIENLDHYYPEHMRLNAMSLRALICVNNANLPSNSCPADSDFSARNELDAQVLLWHPRLLPAHIAMARIDIQRGKAALAAVRLRNALEHAQNDVEPLQIHFAEARMWLAVAELKMGDCEQAVAEIKAVRASLGQSVLDDHPLLAAARSQLPATSTCQLAD